MNASLGRRFGAFAIDYEIVIFLGWAVAWLFGEPTGEGLLEYRMTGPAVLIHPIIWICLLVVPEALWGMTLGKRLLGLVVLKQDGQRLTFGAALVRRLSDIIDFWLSLSLVALISREFSITGQRLGDRVTGAVVTRDLRPRMD